MISPWDFYTRKDDFKRESSASTKMSENVFRAYFLFLVNDILMFGSDRSSLSSRSDEPTSSNTTPRAGGFAAALTGFIPAADHKGSNIRTHTLSHFLQFQQLIYILMEMTHTK